MFIFLVDMHNADDKSNLEELGICRGGLDSEPVFIILLLTLGVSFEDIR